MEIVFDKKSPSVGKISVNILNADYQPVLQKKIKEYSQKANIKGFRPGKVPAALIERLYGKSLKVDVLNDVLFSGIQNYLTEKSITTFGDLILDKHPSQDDADWLSSQDFEFSFDLALIPDFSLPVLEEMKFTYPIISVDEKRIESFIEGTREEYGTKSNVEISSPSTFLIGSLKSADGSIQKTNIMLKVINLDESIRKEFSGKAVNDSITFNIEEFKKESVRNRFAGLTQTELMTWTGDYTFTINEIFEVIPAEMNSDFFDKVVGKKAASTVEEFRELVSKNFALSNEEQQYVYFTNVVKKKLTNEIQIELSVDLIKKQFLSRGDKNITEEGLDKEMPFYIKDLKWELIKSAFAKQFDIKLTEAEILDFTSNFLASEFRNMGMGHFEGSFLTSYAKTYLTGENGANRNRMIELCLKDKITVLVKNKCKLDMKNVSMDEFIRMVEELR